jgi:DNA-binding response OmpR family regulator
MANKKMILVIDDDPDIIDSIKVILESSGFAVNTAMSGQEGIDAAMGNKPDLILCDMMMERIDAGSKVAEELNKKSLNVPIFLLSSIGDATASNIEIDKLGFNGVFQKPVNPEHLINTIRNTLGL